MAPGCEKGQGCEPVPNQKVMDNAAWRQPLIKFFLSLFFFSAFSVAKQATAQLIHENCEGRTSGVLTFLEDHKMLSWSLNTLLLFFPY